MGVVPLLPSRADHTAPATRNDIEETLPDTAGVDRVSPMPFARTAPLRREIEARIPERPFTVEFWDGTRLPASRRRAGRPSTCARRAPPPTRCGRPGQLGLGRAYVSGEIEVDDIDA